MQEGEGWERLRKLWGYAFSNHTPGEQVRASLFAGASLPAHWCHVRHQTPCCPPLQLPPVPEELKEWAQDTVLATFAGMLLGGGRQWAEERRAGAGAAYGCPLRCSGSLRRHALTFLHCVCY